MILSQTLFKVSNSPDILLIFWQVCFMHMRKFLIYQLSANLYCNFLTGSYMLIYFIIQYRGLSRKVLCFIHCFIIGKKWYKEWGLKNPKLSSVSLTEARSSTQPFILPRSIKWVAGAPRGWLVKSKLLPPIGSVAY